MLPLVMPDAKVISGGDFDRLKTSPFGQFVLSMANFDGTQFQNFYGITGFDPRQDLREVMLVSNTTAQTSPGSHQGLVVVRGRFDETKITSAATVKGGVVTSYNGVKVITGPANAATPAPWVAFVSPGLMAIGPQDYVKGAVDRVKSGAVLDPSLASRIQSASSNYHAWVVTTTSPADLAGRLQNPNLKGAMQGDVIQGIEQISAGLRFGANVDVAGDATTRSDRDAVALMDVMRFLIMAGNASQSGLGGALDSLQLTNNGRVVHFAMSLPEQDLERIFRSGRRGARTRPVSTR
jgi:hypothetical protein